MCRLNVLPLFILVIISTPKASNAKTASIAPKTAPKIWAVPGTTTATSSLLHPITQFTSDVGWWAVVNIIKSWWLIYTFYKECWRICKAWLMDNQNHSWESRIRFSIIPNKPWQNQWLQQGQLWPRPEIRQLSTLEKGSLTQNQKLNMNSFRSIFYSNDTLLAYFCCFIEFSKT